MTCQTIEQEIYALIAERNSLYEELHSAVGMGKAPIIAQIKIFNKKISEKKEELAICKEQNPDPQFPILTTNLLGNYTIVIRNLDDQGDKIIGGGFLASVTFDMFRKYITIDSLNPLQASYEFKLWDITFTNTTTVTLRNPSRGSFNRYNRSVIATLPLFFDHSIDFIGEEDSSMDYSLKTFGSIEIASGNIASGNPIDQNGNISLVGEGTFSNGYLKGKISHLHISAKFENIP